MDLNKKTRTCEMAWLKIIWWYCYFADTREEAKERATGRRTGRIVQEAELQ